MTQCAHMPLHRFCALRADFVQRYWQAWQYSSSEATELIDAVSKGACFDVERNRRRSKPCKRPKMASTSLDRVCICV
jgi:hypothetical protein